MFTFNAFTPLVWLFWILGVAAFVVEAWAFIDAVRQPTGAFPAAGKQTKPLWLIILGVSTVIGLYGVAYSGGFSALMRVPPSLAMVTSVRCSRHTAAARSR